MINLRIYRTWEWGCTGALIGDPNPPYELVKHDKLQFSSIWDGHEIWEDVPIIEAERPEHPREAKIRKYIEETRNYMGETRNYMEEITTSMQKSISNHVSRI